MTTTTPGEKYAMTDSTFAEITARDCGNVIAQGVILRLLRERDAYREGFIQTLGSETMADAIALKLLTPTEGRP